MCKSVQQYLNIIIKAILCKKDIVKNSILVSIGNCVKSQFYFMIKSSN